MNKEPWFKMILTTAFTAGSAVWGWFGWLLLAWAVCMGLDFLTGTVAAIRQRDYSSSVARDGLFHKAGMVTAVIASLILDVLISLIIKGTQIKLPWDYSVLIAPLVLTWYSLTELGSILENAVKMGAPVPGWLSGILRLSVQTVNKAGDEITGNNK